MKKSGACVFFLAFTMAALTAFGHELTPEKRKEKITMHRKMAELHKKVSDCLEAGKPLDDCNSEAMKDCPMMGKECPFVEKGHMEKEMMREHMKKMKDQKKE